MPQSVSAIVLTATLIIGSIPIIPSQMTFIYAAQGSYAAQFTPIQVDTSVSSSSPTFTTKPLYQTTGLPLFVDDGTGQISYAVFQDTNGTQVYVQIPNSQYTQMGKKEGALVNPVKDQYISLFQSLSTAQPVQAAINLDASSTAKDNSHLVTSLTWAHTITGANTALAVLGTMFRGDVTVTATSTYNGVPLRLIVATSSGAIPFTNADGWQGWAFLMMNPPQGVANIVVNFSNTSSTTVNGQIAFNAESFNGVRQNNQPDNFGVTATTSYLAGNVGATSTVQTPNSWLFGVADDTGGGIGGINLPGANTKYRSAVVFNQYGADSNGPVGGTGNRALVWNRTAGAGNKGSILALVISLSPDYFNPWFWTDF